MQIGSQGTPACGQPNAVAVTSSSRPNGPSGNCPRPGRMLASVALTPIEILVGKGGDPFDRWAPRNPIMREGILGVAGKGLAAGVGLLGTGFCVGVHVLTHPFSFTRRSVIRVGEMGAATIGGIGFTGVNGAMGALLGAARYPVNVLRGLIDRK